MVLSLDGCQDRLFRATLPELHNIYPSAIVSLQRTIEKQLSELDRCRLPMILLLEAHPGLLGFHNDDLFLPEVQFTHPGG
jgi:hypothetical protein